MSAAIDARYCTCPCRHDMAAGFYHRHDMAAGYYHRHDMAAGAMREDDRTVIKNQLRKDDHPCGADL